MRERKKEAQNEKTLRARGVEAERRGGERGGKPRDEKMVKERESGERPREEVVRE